MTAFTIFQNETTGALAAVYDFAIPTVTGIGVNKEWKAVYHGQTKGLFDKIRQCKEFERQVRKVQISHLDFQGMESDEL